jgi:hypothetical protein
VSTLDYDRCERVAQRILHGGEPELPAHLIENQPQGFDQIAIS